LTNFPSRSIPASARKFWGLFITTSKTIQIKTVAFPPFFSSDTDPDH
jgi:hypothetical protein